MTLRSRKADEIAMWVVRVLWMSLGTVGSFAWENGSRWWALGLFAAALACFPLTLVVGLIFEPRRPERTHSGAEIVSDSLPR